MVCGVASCFLDTSTSPAYAKTLAEFTSFFPISDSTACGLPTTAEAITPYQKATKRGYFEARAIYHDPAKLSFALGNLTAGGVADDCKPERGEMRTQRREKRDG